MLISIVIPTLNRPQMLKRAIKSVCVAAENSDLGDHDYEIIVVDDSEAIIENQKITGKYKQVTHKSNPNGPYAGAASCRNVAIETATGKYIFFLDDDDYFLPNRFAQCLDVFKQGKADVILECSRRETIVDGEKRYHTSGPKTKVDDPFLFMITGDESTHIATGATAFSRDIFYKAGGFDAKLQHCEDGELLLRFCYATNVLLLPGKPVVHCVTHAENTSREENRRFFFNIKSLKHLFINTRRFPNVSNDVILRECTSNKLDYLLFCCRNYTYIKRIYEGALILRFFVWRFLSVKNVKTILVCFFKP